MELAFPKPGARRKPGLLIRTNKSDGRTVEICRTEYQWQKRREEVCRRDASRCRHCGRVAPLHDVLGADGEVVVRAGHAMHRDARKMGGGFRDDSLGNLEWGCWRCHDREHRPAKVVPSKRSLS